MADRRTQAGRQAALLFAVGGFRALLAVVLGRPAGAALTELALADLAVALAAFFLPWHRLPDRATVLLTLPAFAIMSGLEHFALVPPGAVSVPFMIAFAWVGAHHPRRTSLWLLPPAAIAIAVPMLGTPAGLDVRALLLTLGGCVIVAEVIALAAEGAAASHRRAESAARAFGVVARASTALHDLDPEVVLGAVADAVVELGFDGANLAVVDAAANKFRSLHARGISLPLTGTTFPRSRGIAGEVWRTQEPVIVADCQSSPLAAPAVRATGVRSQVAVPVVVRRSVVAVLHGSSARRRPVLEEEVEAMRILAATAGAALETAEQFLAERTTSQKHAAAALVDPLTGVGNRRYAHQLLDALHTSDALVMIDLDHFKDVNDRLGHAAGDAVLGSLAAHVEQHLREVDDVARVGGEEFLVVLRDVEASLAEATVSRLLDGWRATRPLATFSAGLAHHTGGQAAATLERADQALYAAKAAGRDTWRSDPPARVVDVVPRQRPTGVVVKPA